MTTRRMPPGGAPLLALDLSAEQSDAQATHLQTHVDQHGFGFWAVEVPGVAPFLGFVGLKHVEPDLPFAPAIEAGWRLARPYWGFGYATEGGWPRWTTASTRSGCLKLSPTPPLPTLLLGAL